MNLKVYEKFSLLLPTMQDPKGMKRLESFLKRRLLHRLLPYQHPLHEGLHRPLQQASRKYKERQSLKSLKAPLLPFPKLNERGPQYDGQLQAGEHLRGSVENVDGWQLWQRQKDELVGHTSVKLARAEKIANEPEFLSESSKRQKEFTGFEREQREVVGR